MSLKGIKFTDGTVLPIFPHPNYTDYVNETKISTIPYDVSMYTMSNACITAGNMNNGYINEELAGKTLTDLDGNTWAFTKTNNQMDLTISKGDISTTIGLPYSVSWYVMYSLMLFDMQNDEPIILIMRSADSYPMDRHLDITQSYGYYIQAGYANHYNVEYNYYDDIRRVTETGHGYGLWGYVTTHLRDTYKSDPFITVSGLVLNGYEQTEMNALDYYLAPAGSWLSVANISTYLSFKESLTEIEDEVEDPYEPGGNSGTGGGGGSFDNTGDAIDIPSLPTLSATDTGFITIFNPTIAQLQNLSSYMWGSLFDISTYKKLFADPMDCILGLSIVPVSVPNGATQTVKVGNISTGVSMTVAAQQYVEVNCGTLRILEYWGGYLDYAPYTTAEIYLPYIGTHPIDIDDIMGKTVQIVYHVDILSGACTAFIKCGQSVLYEFIGQCASSIPITGNDWTNVINGVLNISSAIGSMVATGGMSAPVAATQIASAAVNDMKPSIEKSGSMSGTGGMLAVQKPYIIITRPRQALPASQNKYTGYPSFITETLGNLSGYTEIESVHLQGIPATDEELREIETLLKGGVIL